jgi:serine protease Do
VIRRVGLNIEDSPTGVLVTAVIPGTPGDAAGLQPGDVIVSLDGAEVKRSSAFISEVTRHAPGAIGSIEVMRNGSRCGVSVTY